MDELNPDAKHRLDQYLQSNAITVSRQLGFGMNGAVTESSRKTALKIHDDEAAYLRERNSYLRLRRRNIVSISGCHVPRLVDFDDRLWIIEMTLVRPPFLLDFGGAYLDVRPDFSAEMLADWEADRSERFGDDWTRVLEICGALAAHGIYYYDAHPGNIRLK